MVTANGIPDDARLTGRAAGKMLCDALGLNAKYVRSITLYCDRDEAARIEVEAYATAGGVRTGATFLQQYHLVPTDDIVEVTSIGDTERCYVDAIVAPQGP